jgi:predicted transcriptional regulator
MPIPFGAKHTVKTDVTSEVKFKLQKLAKDNKRSMRKQLEHIIEQAVEENDGKENNS